MRILIAFCFCLCALLATAATRTVHVRGTIGNLHELGLQGRYSALNIRSATWLGPASGPDPGTKQFEGEVECNVVRDAHGQWVDIELTAMAYGQGRDRSMFIRVPYARSIDLGTFDWKPSRYRWKPDGLRMETALPRDTVIGAVDDPAVLYISPINPTPEDTVRITVEWTTSGQPMVADQQASIKDVTRHLAIRFGVRTDTDVYGDSWLQRATPWVYYQLQAGRYRVHQVPLDTDAVQDIDLLFGKELFFTVGERKEP
ncbi:MAG: hypothetical protein ABI432_08280 [Flavobacteriales bacterium]